MTTDRRPRNLILAALAALALVLAACSSSGSDDAGKDDATTTTAAKGSTTTADDESTTTEGDDSDDETISSDDLEALLPAASDLGSGWEEDSSSDDSDTEEFDQAIADQCPDAAALSNDDEDSDEVKRAFVDESSRRIEVAVTGSAQDADEGEIDALIEAINACDTITIEGEDGTTTTLDLDAQPSSDYGDEAIQFQAAVNISASTGESVDLNMYLLLFHNGPVGVRISVMDGLDDTTLEVTEADSEVAIGLADQLDQASAELAGT